MDGHASGRVRETGTPFDAAARAMAARYGFSGCDVVPLCYSENRTYLVSEPGGGRRVATLRICRPGYRSLEELCSEVRWILSLRRALRIADVSPVKPLEAPDGSLVQVIDLPDAQPLHGIAFAWMDGTAPDEIDDKGMLRLFGRLGNLAAHMHSCDATGSDTGEVSIGRIVQTPPSSTASGISAYPDGSTKRVAPANHVNSTTLDTPTDSCSPTRLGTTANPGSPTRLARPSWDCRTCLGASATWGDWRAFLGAEQQDAVLIARCEAQVREALALYGTSQDRFGLIHADMRLANLLVDGEILSLLDFDDSGFSWRLFDLAASLSFIEARPDMPDLAMAWLDAYRRVRPLGPADLAAVPVLIMLRRLQLTGWLASRPDSDPVEGFSRGWLADTLVLADEYLSGTLCRLVRR